MVAGKDCTAIEILINRVGASEVKNLQCMGEAEDYCRHKRVRYILPLCKWKLGLKIDGLRHCGEY